MAVKEHVTAVSEFEPRWPIMVWDGVVTSVELTVETLLRSSSYAEEGGPSAEQAGLRLDSASTQPQEPKDRESSRGWARWEMLWGLGTCP